ncbi:uncharacterized protein [Watersipora subatra]|uniref:uncharacterized protein n=1 Tax=Watersipora subatra TaxID=2589382 RepID=UPI00355BA867
MLYLQPIEESLTFTFVTDYSEGYAGFVIEYSEVDGIPSYGHDSAAEIGVIPIERGGNSHSAASSRRLMHIVTHKGYPILPYGSNINCSLTLTGLSAYPLYRIDLTARSGIELNSNCNDFLDLLGITSHIRIKICGGELEDLTYYVNPSTDSMSFWFITSQKQTYQGVLLVYSAVLPIYLEKNFHRRVSSRALSYIATHKRYPGLYHDNIDSALTITDIPPQSQIRLDFTAHANIALEYMCLDYVNITGVSGYENNTVQICGTEAPQPTLYLNVIDESLTFIFFTDDKDGYHGFVMEYSVISQPDTTELVSTTVVTSASSPLISIDPTASATSIEETAVALIAVVCALVMVIIVLVVILVQNRRKSALSASKAMSVALAEVNPPPRVEPSNIDSKFFQNPAEFYQT